MKVYERKLWWCYNCRKQFAFKAKSMIIKDSTNMTRLEDEDSNL